MSCGYAVLRAALLMVMLTGVWQPSPGLAQGIGLSEAQARRFFMGKTRVTFMPGHGTQVSYMRPDGAIFLWYPGNSVVVPGRWDIEEYPNSPGSSRVCFRYGPNTYNPVTRQAGGQRNCMPAHLLALVVVDRADGDVFGLSQRPSAPFVLSQERTSISALKARLGR